MVNGLLLGADLVLFGDFLRLLYLSKKHKEQKEKFTKNVAWNCICIGALAFLVYGYLLYSEGNGPGFIGGSIILLFLFGLILIEELELPPYCVKTKKTKS